MNSYEYICQSCGHDFPSSDAQGAKSCPRCGSPDLKHNRWLLGTPQWEGLAPEDHYYAGLAV